ncbi:hypothetical protein [Pedobacter sp. Hv1]|uniref:DUF6965 family protein n=1 Tax=Pedobacter sp. Hv1 TaxID=1740090 RepID=UPI0006D8A90B|nr:hypothetical protein [Pedobacter sp. Hv1]KQC02118.1 hypothetical protein AQF98_00655 [Pedobacter sp. Hv1]
MTIQELENWFKNVELPATPIMLLPGTTITDVDKFLESHFIPLRANPNALSSKPIWDRLFAFKLLIESNL